MDWSYPLLAACERTPRRIALRHRGRSQTYAELEQAVAAAAGAFAALDAAGRTVGWLLPTAPPAIEISMALARVGATAVPLNPRLTHEELAFVARDAGLELLVAAPEHVDAAIALGDLVPGLRVVLAGDPSAAPAGVLALACAGDAAAAPDGWTVDERQVATIMYTSGTTGVPKGVARSHRANAWNVVNSALGSPRTGSDVELFTLPAFGIGLLHFAIPVLLAGATLVLDDQFDPARAWDLLEGERCTRAFLAPTMLSAMLATPGHEHRDCSRLATISTAYEFPRALRERAVARFGDVFAYMYGLTEAQLTCARVGDLMAHPDRVGAAMGVARLRVVGPDGRSLPTGETGEIAFHGPSVMDGYHGRAAETAAALHDGWVRTGDLGRLDEDGQLHYAGRTKEMIKTGGFSVDPREVEDALVAVPGIREAAVIGVPDEHWGEMVVAFVAPRGAVAPDELRAACREHLAGYKLPKQILEVDRLPLNATGKVQRGVLRERYAAGGPPEA